MTPLITVRLAPRHALCEQAEALAVKLHALWTADELRANALLIDQILASLGTLTWSKKS